MIGTRSNGAGTGVLRSVVLLATTIACLTGCGWMDSEPEKPEAAPVELVVHHPDGRVTLNSYLPEHLVIHMRNCLVNGERELLFEQVMSEELKRRYTTEGRDPREALEWLFANQRDVLILLNRMDRGLQSQQVKWEQRGGVLRLQAYGRSALDLRFRTLDLIRENRQYRFLLIK